MRLLFTDVRNAMRDINYDNAEVIGNARCMAIPAAKVQTGKQHI